MTADRNRTTVRRALRAAAVVGAVVLVLGLLLTASAGIPLRVVVASALVLASFVAAGWLLLSMLLDMIAGDPPDRRRNWWTLAATVVAMAGPFVLLGLFVETAR